MEMPTIPSIVIAAIMSITGLGYLWYYTTYWSTQIEFYLGVFLLIAVFAALVLIMWKFGKLTKSTPLRTTDFAVIAVFVALNEIVNWAAMFAPGPLAVIPWVIALVRYIPEGIVMAALLKIVPKPGVGFAYLIGQFLIGSVTATPSPLWVPRYILSAFALEAYYLTSKRGTLSSLLLAGFSFGIFSSAFGNLFFLAAWSYWQPLLLTLPAVILSGIAMLIGASVGYGIGSRATKITI